MSENQNTDMFRELRAYLNDQCYYGEFLDEPEDNHELLIEHLNDSIQDREEVKEEDRWKGYEQEINFDKKLLTFIKDERNKDEILFALEEWMRDERENNRYSREEPRVFGVDSYYDD